MVQRPPEKPKDLLHETPTLGEPSFEQNNINTEQPSFTPEQTQVPQQEQAAPIQAVEYQQQTEQKADREPDSTNSTEGTLAAIKRKFTSSKKNRKGEIPQVRDELMIQVENIMSFGLEDAFKALTPIQQQEFKIKGEETAQEIRRMFSRAHIKIKNIFKLVVEWLKILPGINKFYLEQEAKIKTDRLVSLYQQQKHRQNK